MKRHPSKPTEAETKKAVKDYLRAKKILYVQINQIRPVTNPKTMETYFIAIDAELRGAPDLIVWRPMILHGGHERAFPTLALEIKSYSGRQTDDQKAWQKRAEAVGIEYHIVRSLEDVEKGMG